MQAVINMVLLDELGNEIESLVGGNGFEGLGDGGGGDGETCVFEAVVDAEKIHVR